MSTFLFYSKIMKVVIVLLKNGDNINQDKELDELLCKRVGRGKRQKKTYSYLKPQIKSSGKGIFSKDNQEAMKYSCI